MHLHTEVCHRHLPHVCVCVCVCVCECVCVCARERERERGCVQMCVLYAVNG